MDVPHGACVTGDARPTSASATESRAARAYIPLDDTSEDDSTSAAPDDTSKADSTSAAPPLLSTGETTAGTTLPSVSVPPIVGSKAREQRISDVTTEVDAGRMQKPGGKQVSWSRTEHLKLRQAVDWHGRAWAAVSRDVGSKTRKQCLNKVNIEVAAGRMDEPGGKREHEPGRAGPT